MSEKEYLENRLEDQINYYNTNSSVSKKKYYFLKSSEISIAVIIPFLTGYIGKEDTFVKYIIGILSVILALLTGLEVLFKFHDKWITYRSTAESLVQEKFMFLYKAGPYKNDNTLSVLVERVETILAKENSTWNQLMNQPENKNNK